MAHNYILITLGFRSSQIAEKKVKQWLEYPRPPHTRLLVC